MSIGFMSHVDFKKRQCRPVEFKGQGPFGSYKNRQRQIIAFFPQAGKETVSFSGRCCNPSDPAHVLPPSLWRNKPTPINLHRAQRCGWGPAWLLSTSSGALDP